MNQVLFENQDHNIQILLFPIPITSKKIRSLTNFEKKSICYPVNLNLFRLEINYFIYRSTTRSLNSEFQALIKKAEDKLYDTLSQQNFSFAFLVETNDCLLSQFLFCNNWFAVTFEDSSQGMISPFSSQSCARINIIQALQTKEDSNILLQSFQNHSSEYLSFLKDLGFETNRKEFILDSLKTIPTKSEEFVHLYLSTVLVKYEKIVALTWIKERVTILLGIFPSVGQIREKEFAKDTKNINPCEERIELLTILCNPSNLDLAVQLCVVHLQKAKLSLGVFYFYPFQDAPNDILQQFDVVSLSSYTIFRALKKSGFFRNIGKYNKFGILQFTNLYKMEKIPENPIPYNYFPFEIQEIEKVLSEGSYGCTLLARLTNQIDKSKAVIKILTMDKQVEADILYEIDLHDLLDTYNLPHIPTFVGAKKYKSADKLLESVSVSSLQEKCPTIAKKLLQTKKPVYTIAMSAATGGSIHDLYQKKLSNQDIQSLIFQGLFTLFVLETKLGFYHRDLNSNNLLYIDQKQELWQYKYQNTTWFVPIPYTLQFIDFGLSGTEKSNNPYLIAGTPGYQHPLYMGITKYRSWKWTIDWYSLGKHMFSMAIRNNINAELNYWVMGNVNFKKLIKRVRDQEEKETFEDWIQEIIWLELLGHSAVRTHAKKRFEKILSESFWNTINSLFEQIEKPLKELLVVAEKNIGTRGLELIRELCQWEYYEASAFTLLNHPYFQNYQIQPEKIQILKTVSI